MKKQGWFCSLNSQHLAQGGPMTGIKGRTEEDRG